MTGDGPMRSAELVYKGRRRSVSFFGALPEREAAEWRTWFTRHGIDPDDVDPLGGVAADDVDRFVEYAPAGFSDQEMKVVGGRLARSVDMVRVQLEARALPFPVLRKDVAG